MADLEVISKTCPGKIFFLGLKGFLDAHTFERLDKTISSLFNQGHYRIIVDLSGVGYIGSAGAGVFIGALGKARDHQGDLVFLTPSHAVQEVLDLLGLSQIFRIAKTLEEAQSFFSSSAA